jgi:hypothetical protein
MLLEHGRPAVVKGISRGLGKLVSETPLSVLAQVPAKPGGPFQKSKHAARKSRGLQMIATRRVLEQTAERFEVHQRGRVLTRQHLDAYPPKHGRAIGGLSLEYRIESL